MTVPRGIGSTWCGGSVPLRAARRCSSIEHVYAINAATGQLVADYDAGAGVWSAPAIRPDGTVVVAERTSSILVLG